MPKSGSRGKTRKATPITKAARTTSRIRNDLTGQALIRHFHKLQSGLQSASDSKDEGLVHELQSEIDKLGGLDQYQKASIRGQDKRRGGDSSKQLVQWLKDEPTMLKCSSAKMRVLEIGCLSPENFISKVNTIAVSRIDLNSQHASIQQQNFLDRPEPASEEEEFDGISVSLVLNFVPISQRSEFLHHLTKFLPVSSDTNTRWMFLVMPLPCIKNSRYMNKKIFVDMLGVLGFTVLKERMTDRIVYWLFARTRETKTGLTFKKKEVLSGSGRNNFWLPLTT